MPGDAVTASAADRRSDYVSGVALILAGTVAFSTAGLFVRLIGKDAATILFWRGLFTVLAITAYVAVLQRRAAFSAFLAIGWSGLAIAFLSAVSMGAFVASLQFTTVANNSIIFGTGPFMTAALAWLMIRERPSVATMTFAAVALSGALLVVGSSLTLSTSALIGDGLAVLMTVAFAVKTVLTRQYRHIPMVPAACVGALMGSVGAAPFVPSWSIGVGELGMFALFGFTQQAAGMILTTIGIARVPAAHSALLMALDLPMSPVWVWLLLGEAPTAMGIVGGIIVAFAILGHIVVEGRRRGSGLPRWMRWSQR